MVSASASSARASAYRRSSAASTAQLLDHSSVQQAIPHAPDVDDEGPRIDGVEPAAQARRVRVERSRPSQRPESPDLAEELLLREDALRLGSELHEQLELPGGHGDPHAV